MLWTTKQMEFAMLIKSRYVSLKILCPFCNRLGGPIETDVRQYQTQTRLIVYEYIICLECGRGWPDRQLTSVPCTCEMAGEHAHAV